jgi:hypothetical protein
VRVPGILPAMAEGRVVEVSDEDLERLASRIAMLASENGEADNAGRAVAALARRLGLTGGQLKAFFLNGATERRFTLPRATQAPDAAAEIDRLTRELSALRHGLKLTEVQARNAQRERDALRSENTVLMEALDRARSAEQVRKFVGAAAVAAAILGAIVLYAGPVLRPLTGTPGVNDRPTGSPFLRQGVIRAAGASVLRSPEPGSMMVTQLAAGSRVQVRQVIWRGLMQWAEVEAGGVVGYVVSTEIDIP